MSTLITLLSISGAIAIGAMSPGPSFVMVARTSVASTRANGLAAALGMGVGGVSIATAALLGMETLLATIPWLYFGLKVMGGIYLLYLAYKIWSGAKQPLIISTNKEESTQSLKRSFMLALGTQLSNPKTAVVYGSIFVSLLPRKAPTELMAALPLFVFAIETAWYCVVALVLSSTKPRNTYLRYKSWIDRIAGSVMAMLGARLIATAAE